MGKKGFALGLPRTNNPMFLVSRSKKSGPKNELLLKTQFFHSFGGRGEAKEFFHVTEPLSGLPSLTKGRKCHRAPWGPQPHWTIC